MKRAILGLFILSILAVLAFWMPEASARSGFYSTFCADCHASVTSTTCAGCHGHGVHSDSSKSDMNVTGVTDKTTYSPGETVSVTIDGGYRSGWVRAILYDQNMTELARSTGPTGMGGGASFPITLTAQAPTTGGTYTWNVSWYGNQYDLAEVGGTTFFGPRWTPDPNNANHGEEIVSTNAFTVSAAAAPDINLDPAALDFGMVTIGGSATLTALVENLGTADLNVTAITLCAGAGTEFTWSPDAPFTVTSGSSQTLSVTYSPADVGTDTGCLEIASNDQTTPVVSLNVTGTGMDAQPAVLDLDIKRFSATKRVSLARVKPVAFTLSVKNAGTVDGTAPATLVGIQNNAEIYNESITVSDPVGNGGSRYEFPPYTPLAAGDIMWTVTITDEDPDIDTATATTTVVP